tara:strand:- start:151 stop:597 length:447 start_codon:yes stop_codon:yes gene_type:complete
MQLKQINQPSVEDYLETLATRARSIMHEARDAAKALLNETTRLERYITERLATHGIIAHSIAIRYQNEGDCGGWYLTGNFEIPPTLDDYEAIDAFEQSLPDYNHLWCPGDCDYQGSYQAHYSRNESRMWVYDPDSEAIKLGFEFTNIY